MNQLVIKLTGEIVETNFDEWKKDLLVQIESTRKELKSKTDFAFTTDQANDFKKV